MDIIIIDTTNQFMVKILKGYIISYSLKINLKSLSLYAVLRCSSMTRFFSLLCISSLLSVIQLAYQS